jgi:cellulose synthase/poly-beta-1,6-N-acetylglucosamine synthase-like glycosyltransferase
MSMNAKVSIGICTSNDESTIKFLLHNITKQIYEYANGIELIEILIVSSGCTDNTNEIIEDFIKRFPDKITLITEKTRNGKASALNLIFQEYKGEYIILLPADVIVSRKSVDQLITYLLTNPTIGVVSGQAVVNHKHSKCDFVCKIGSILWDLHNLNLAKLNILANNHATGEFMALRKGIIYEIPTTVINDDAYISIIAKQQGWLIGYEPKALVYITVPSRLLDYFIQRKRVVMGHKQLKSLNKIQSTTSKSLFFQKPLFIIPLIIKSIHGYRNLFYFLIAIMLEIYIEFLFISKISSIEQTSYIWKRIQAKKIPTDLFN